METSRTKMPTRIIYDHHKTLRYGSILGAILVSGSLLFLFFPFLAQLSFHTYLALGALFGGILLLSIDLWSNLQGIKNCVKRELISKSRTIVLDDVLRDVFAMDGGIAGCIIGTIGLYSLPIFTKEQRVRIIRATCPPDMDVQTFLFSPGGISVFLPNYIRRILFDATSSNIRDEGRSLSLLDSSIIDVGAHGIGYDENDLSWDPTDESNDSTFSLRHDTGDEIRDANNPRHRNHDQCLIEPSHQKKPDPLNDLYIVLLEQLSQALDHISSNQVRVIGVGAALACIFQLKRQPSTRRRAMNVLHGAFLTAAAGTAFGAFGILGVKNLVSKSLNKSQERTAVPTTAQNFILKWLSITMGRMKSDAKFRKRWQVVFAFSIFALVGRKRRKQILLMTSPSC